MIEAHEPDDYLFFFLLPISCLLTFLYVLIRTFMLQKTSFLSLSSLISTLEVVGSSKSYSNPVSCIKDLLYFLSFFDKVNTSHLFCNFVQNTIDLSLQETKSSENHYTFFLLIENSNSYFMKKIQKFQFSSLLDTVSPDRVVRERDLAEVTAVYRSYQDIILTFKLKLLTNKL